MENIIKSASKLAFLGLIATACAAFLIGVWRGDVKFDSKDFMVLAAAASAFYFSYKGETKPPAKKDGEEDAPMYSPYAGK